jgi:hypothetical protein
VDAVVETMRGHFLGRVIWEGQAIPNTGIPGKIQGFGAERVIHAPAEGRLSFVKDESGNMVEIGAMVKKGQTIAMIEGTPVKASLDGVLRGLIQEGFPVKKGLKIADIDPRPEQAAFCGTVSDKANAVAGGVLEALLGLAASRSASSSGQRRRSSPTERNCPLKGFPSGRKDRVPLTYGRQRRLLSGGPPERNHCFQGRTDSRPG